MKRFIILLILFAFSISAQAAPKMCGVTHKGKVKACVSYHAVDQWSRHGDSGDSDSGDSDSGDSDSGDSDSSDSDSDYTGPPAPSASP